MPKDLDAQDRVFIDSSAIRALRGQIGATQGMMAMLLDMPLRTYEDLENDRVKVRGVHMWAAQMAAMRHYVATEKGSSVLPDGLLVLARAVVKKADEEAAGQ